MTRNGSPRAINTIGNANDRLYAVLPRTVASTRLPTSASPLPPRSLRRPRGRRSSIPRHSPSGTSCRSGGCCQTNHTTALSPRPACQTRVDTATNLRRRPTRAESRARWPTLRHSSPRIGASVSSPTVTARGTLQHVVHACNRLEPAAGLRRSNTRDGRADRTRKTHPSRQPTCGPDRFREDDLAPR